MYIHMNMYMHMCMIVFSQNVTVASSIIGTSSMFNFDPDDLMNTYSLVVTCEISPTSSAKYCEVIARNNNTIISCKLCNVTTGVFVCNPGLKKPVLLVQNTHIPFMVCTHDLF